MITFEKALKLILGNVSVLGAQRIDVVDSVGRVLDEDIHANVQMPPFNKSAMDGYALKVRDIKDVPVKLKNIGIIQAGQVFRKKVKRGECVKIMTGAALPEGADAVVKVEDARQVEKYVEIMQSVRTGENVCDRGEDIKRGQRLLKKGTVISTSDIALLATTGRQDVKGIRKPNVAVLNTGGEIVPAGCRLKKRQIYNSNGPQFLALLKSDQISPTFLGIVKDEPNELREAIQKGLKSDVLLISGGVSMGDYDLVPDVLKSLGVKTIFHGVKTKPGRPLLFGRRANTVVFGVPGNPVANFLAYYIYIRPALYKLQGHKCCTPGFAQGTIEESFRQETGRRHFAPVKIFRKGSQYYLTFVRTHGSADILALSKADGFMVVDEDTSIVKAGSKMKFLTWK